MRERRFVEVPIEFHDREKGHSKINLREAISAIRILATLAFASPGGAASEILNDNCTNARQIRDRFAPNQAALCA